MLKYYLTDNPLTERPDDQMAQTIVDRTYEKEAIITEILLRGNLVTKTDTLAVLNVLEEIIVVIPNLPVGEYTLKIVTQSSGGDTLLISPHTYTPDKVFTVA